MRKKNNNCKDRKISHIAVALICVSLIGSVKAEVITDGTVGPTATVSGPAYIIPGSLGTQSGSNLFHSFTTFNINTDESATFTGPAAAGINNIISRVTGGSFTNIDGEIGSDVAGANLWLVNPNGIVFGNNASINVSGSFHASTAENVKFDDSSEYGTTVLTSPVLSVSNPEGFGFVSTSPASIVVNGSNLNVPSGETLSLVAGDINLINASASAPDGRVNLAAVGSPGDVTFTTPTVSTESGINTAGVTTMADVSLTSSTISTSGDGGGSVYIVGDQFVLDPGSSIHNDNVDSNGNVIHINANNVTLNEGLIESSSSGIGQGGDIIIQGNNLTIEYDGATSSRILTETGLVTEATGTGNGGKIEIDVLNSVILDGGVIRTFAQSTGKGGDIDLNSTDLQLINGGKIFFSTSTSGTGGNINIDTTNEVIVAGIDSKIEIQTFGNADAGDIDININTGNLLVTDEGQISTDSFSTGLGAGINITADDMTVSNEGRVNARTTDDTGAGVNIDLTNQLLVTSDASISTDTFNDGDGSNLNITAKNVGIADGGQISASTKRNGQAGAINVTATDIIRVTGRNEGVTGFFSVSGDPDPFFQDQDYFGVGGNINLMADQIIFENGAIASAEAINLGNAGDILLNAADKVEIMSSSLQTSADNSAGGNIDINATNLVHLVNSDVTAEAFGVTPGNDGGNVSIDPINVVLNNSNLIARANAGNGGNITIVGTAFLRTPTSDLNATSRTGVDGEVLIETLNQNVNIIPVVNESYLDIAGLLNNRCAVQLLKSRSSFTIELNNGVQSDSKAFNHYDHLSQDEGQKFNQRPYLFAHPSLLDLACL